MYDYGQLKKKMSFQNFQNLMSNSIDKTSFSFQLKSLAILFI